jgi:8-amino-7-oxononanoate synthase
MTELEQFAKQNLLKLAQETNYRQLRTCTRTAGNIVQYENNALISFSCNDYLGLSTTAQVKQAAIDAITCYGTSAGASRMVTGNHPLYGQLESRLAKFNNSAAACIFGSGYLANLGTISALMSKWDLIIADKLCHASMVDGIRLSGAKFFRFAHNDLGHAEDLLKKYRPDYRNCLVLTESVFSMDGDLSPTASLIDLARKYRAWFLTDNAHQLVADNIHQPLQTGTLSKYIGSYGGYVTGDVAVIDYIRNRARSLIFSTGLPASVLASALASLDIIEREPHLLHVPLQKAQLFTELLGLPAATSHIVPLIIGSNDDALQASATLKQAGFLVVAIRPPTVAHGTARLRFTFSASHRDADVARLAHCVRGVLKC